MLYRIYLYTGFISLLIGLGAPRAQAQSPSATATLRGTALDAKTGEPLIGATVLVLQTSQGTAAGLDGSFVLSGLTPGPAVVQCQSVGYVAQRQDVTLAAGQTLKVAFRLAATASELGEAVVTGQADRESATAARRSEQKADNVLNIIAARTIELSPDVTVGNVVQRASGVSVVRNSGGDGQYAIIRGMDRRYNYTLVNGIKIPSPDPKNRYVPLDIFPAELLERLEVIKALTPSLEGDAIGGAMNLVMKSAPDHLVVAATAAGGYSDLFAQRPFAGFSPSGVARSPGEGQPAEYSTQASDFSNRALNYSSVKVPINSLFGLTLGNRTQDGKLGLLVAGSLQSTHRGSDRLFYNQPGQPLAEPLPNSFTFNQIERREYSLLQTRSGLHAKLDYAPNAANRLSLYSLLVRLDDAQHRTITVNDLDVPGDVPTTDQSRFQRQQLWSETLRGDHTLAPCLTLNWSAVYGRATLATPDQTEIDIKRSTGPNTQQGTFVKGSSHLWQHSLDQDVAGYANLSFAVTEALEITGGGMGRGKHRSNVYDYYNLVAATTGTGTENQQPYTTNGQARFAFNGAGDSHPKTTDGNNYTATERIGAGYLQGKLQLLDRRLQLLGGVRFESTSQDYVSQLPETTPGRTGRFSYLDILPSAHLKYLLSDQQNVRLSYFKGISRPNLFELIPATNDQDSEYYTTSGNPYLKHTQADNLDLRYEQYGAANAQLLAGVFYKRIQNPIENGFVQVGNNSVYYQPRNFGDATNFGAELVFTKYLRNWGLTGNYTYTHSRITTTKRVYYRDANGNIQNADAGQPTADFPTPPTQTRPLQGQSDHIANLALLYRSEPRGFNAQVAAVYTGRRINTVSPYRDLDQWQRATTQLDFSAEQKLPAHLTIFLKVTNLLNTPTIVEVLQTPTASLLTLPGQRRADRILVQRDEFSRTYLLGLRYRLN